MEDERVLDLHRLLRRALENVADVLRGERDETVIGRLDDRVGIEIDGGVEDGAAIFVAIGRNVGSAAGETEAERGSGAHDHSEVPVL